MKIKLIHLQRLLSALCLVACASSLLMLSSCKEEEAPPPPAPVITSFSPASGAAGTTVIITGENFSISPAATVTFNGVVSTVTSGSSTQLVTTVPATATSGKIAVSGNGTSTSATDFVVLQAPTITSFTPASGMAGTTVTITGTNFSATAANNVVKFNGTAGTVTSSSATSITTTIPVNATSGKISVTVDGLTATSATGIIIKKQPTITSFTPSIGSVGTLVEVTGTNFMGQTVPAAVRFNSISLEVLTVTDTKLTFTMPGHITGTVTAKFVVTVDELTATSSNDFTYVPAPVITSFSPTYGLAGTKVTLTGRNFSATPGDNKVTVGGKVATVVSASEQEVQIVIPDNPASGKIILTLVSTPDAGVITQNSFEALLDIPRNGLVLFYPFNGNGFDSSNSGINGTVNGATLVPDRFNTGDHAYNFSKNQSTGITDHVYVGNPIPLQITNSITISFWVKKTAFSEGTVISKNVATNQSGTEGHGYTIRLNGDGAVGAYTAFIRYPGNGTQGLNFAGGVVFTPKVWQHCVFTLTGQSAKFYKDGVLVEEFDNHQPLTASSLGNFYIGRSSENAFVPFEGIIDDVAIYNRAVNAAEAMQIFKQTVTKY